MTQPNVTTHHNDNSRTGAYLAETRLRPATVNAGTFGRLYTRHVEGDVYAQVLYVRGVSTGSGTKNLFFVATSTNMVYAFDADNLSTNPDTPAVWSRRLDPFRILSQNEICRETVGSVGITSTPVIDTSTGTMYVVSRRSTGTPGATGDGDNFLHALDIRNGTDRLTAVRVGGAVAGTGPFAGTTITFNVRCHRNRPALLLMNGVVYVAFGTFSCDGWCSNTEPYHGWVMGYRATDLAPAGVFCTTTGAAEGGIWQSGAGLVGGPDGSIYFATGNDALLGGSPVPGTAGNLGDSVVRLTTPGLSLAGHFTPRNAAFLRDGYGTQEQFGDTDLGSGGPTLLPGGTLVVGGKQGRLYVLDATTMAPRQDTSPPDWALAGVNPDHIGEGFQAFYNLNSGTNPRTPRALDNYASSEHWGPNIHGNPVYWSGSGCVYHMSEKDHLKAYRYDATSRTVSYGVDPDPVSRAITPFAQSTETPNQGMPGGACSVSANGGTDGIVWVSYPQSDGQWQKVPGFLVAYNATAGGPDGRTLVELYRDAGTDVLFAKFNPPTVADGKVFRSSFAPNGPDPNAPNYMGPASIVVYGLRA